jgi:septal ring-binding cell division protein DamX
MHHDKKGTLLMLGTSHRELPTLAGPDPLAKPSQAAPAPGPAPQGPDDSPAAKGPKQGAAKGAKQGPAKADKKDKRRHREVIAAELGAVSEALQHLRDRVGDLHRQHLDREASQSGLAAQISALGAAQAQAHQRGLSLESRVEALRLSLDGLRSEAAAITDALADLAVAPDRDTALFALEDRIQEAEASIADLRGLLDQAPGEAGQSAGWAEDLAALHQGLAAQGERLTGVEGALAQDAASPAVARLEQALATHGANLDGQILSLDRDLATLRDQNRRWREVERSWAEERIQGLRRGLVGGIGLLALLLLGGFAATWWHGERQLDLIADRMAAVEQAANARFSALADPGSARVEDRLVPVLGQLGAALQGIQASTEALGARIAALPTQDQAAGSSAARTPEHQAVDVPAGAQTMAPPVHSADPVAQRAQPQVEPSAEPQVEPQTLLPATSLAETQAETQPQGPSPEALPALDTAAPVEPLAAVAAPSPESDPASAPAPAQAAFAVEEPAPSEPLVQADPQTQVQPPGSEAAPGLSAQVQGEQLEPAAAGALVLDSERYTIQLIGFRTPARIAAFASDQGISGEARWLQAPGKGRAWYLVVLGDYGTRQEAQAALAELPPRLKTLSPVIRPLAAGTELMPAQ